MPIDGPTVRIRKDVSEDANGLEMEQEGMKFLTFARRSGSIQLTLQLSRHRSHISEHGPLDATGIKNLSEERQWRTPKRGPVTRVQQIRYGYGYGY